MTRYDRASITLAVGLSGLAGYVDAHGFLSVGNFFVSFMSGNSTRLGVGLAEGRFPYVLLALGVIALFVAGVVAGTLVSRQWKERRRPAVLILVAGLLAFAAVLHELRHPMIATGALLLAMGAENAVFQGEGEVSIGVTYMTGALVKLGQALAAIAYQGPRWAWTPYALLWLGLVTGATLGAAAKTHLAMHGLWLAVPYALALAGFSTRTRTHYA